MEDLDLRTVAGTAREVPHDLGVGVQLDLVLEVFAGQRDKLDPVGTQRRLGHGAHSRARAASRSSAFPGGEPASGALIVRPTAHVANAGEMTKGHAKVSADIAGFAGRGRRLRSVRGAAVAAFVAALMLMEGAGSAAVAAPASGRSEAAAAAGETRTAPVEERPCPVTVPAGTTCGYLLVPERRDVPNSRTIKVGYAVHRAGGEAPGEAPGQAGAQATVQAPGQAGAQDADPVVYMSGGPGSASLPLTGLLTRMLPGRDVVVLEQRGGRYSEPRLSCPEIVEGIVDTLRTPGPTVDETAAVVRRAGACQSRLESEHVDLRGYRTAEIAADIVDLRAALGYRRWYLFGVSYSTRPMLRAAALDPEGSRGVVLDSLLPHAPGGTTSRPARSWPPWPSWGSPPGSTPRWPRSTPTRPRTTPGTR